MWKVLVVNVLVFLLWIYSCAWSFYRLISSCFMFLCCRTAVPLGLRWCDVPSGLLRSCSSRLSDAGLQFGSFNCEQGRDSVASLVCAFLICMINRTCEPWREYAQCDFIKWMNLCAGFVVSRVSRLGLTTVTATQANCPLCLWCYRGQGLWALSLCPYRYAVRSYTQT